MTKCKFGTISIDFLGPNVKSSDITLLVNQVKTIQYFPFSSNLAKLHTSQFVFVRRGPALKGMQSPYEGPVNIKHMSDKYCDIQWASRVEQISIDILKSRIVPDDAIPALSPPQGRPKSP
ncbi:unnamed protein product [Lepeophtheirus salmonis]|uniref:(salmon louse) hypothetical protein n=1 Tax=Lepeophtheirus salmonis TaxID=72036 RepID=A0A7R8CLH2_LEPSM|nr:unnamed protein product [Lepeophtheirus salmonis]CAF2828227.1 unnamed protein product [Lepeophtheirus salmonis]